MDILSIIILLLLIPLYKSYKALDNINKQHKKYTDKIDRLNSYEEAFQDVWKEFQSFAPMNGIKIKDSRIAEGYEAFSVDIEIQTRTRIIEYNILIRTADGITIHQLISGVLEIKRYNSVIDELNSEMMEVKEMEIQNV